MIFSHSDLVNKLTSEPEKNILIIIKEAKLILGGLFCVYNKLDSKHSVLVGTTNEMTIDDQRIIDDAEGHICYEATMACIDETISISDLSLTEFSASDPVVATFNLKSYLGAPVRLNNKAIGALAIVDTIVREFTDNEKEVINSLALLIMLEEEHLLTIVGLKRSEFRYDALFQNANDCIVLLKNDVIIDINPKGYQMFGYINPELLGKTIVDLSPSDKEVKSRNGYNKKGYLTNVLKGIPQSFEWLHKKKDGSVFFTEISLSLLEGSDEYNILAIIRDISSRKEYEEELIEAKRKADEANKLKSLSLASMSHELRTPLNSIIGFSDLLLDDDTTDDEREQFTMLIQTAGRSLMQLIGDIIDISKIEAGEVTIQKSIFNVNSFLQEVLLTFRHEKENRGKSNIELKLILSDQISDLKIETDSHRLRQVFSNLLTNSLKFVEEGYIEFGYSSVSPTNIQFFVKDTGVGIRADKKDVIFDQYGQDKDTYSRNKEGTGLGLAISKSFVELLGGDIWVDSELDEGSTFYFTIPFQDNSSIQNDSYVNLSLNIEGVNWSNHTILVVDDVKQNYLYLKGLLQHTKATILWVKNGKESVDICHVNNSIDMILMDIRMPVMDGFEAAKIIRQSNPNIFIVAQTAFSSPEDRKRCLDSYCDGYLTKPINYKDLFSVLSKLFDRMKK
ncbi:MAG: ATP-binding protein [Bacteroidota bacterium]